MDETEKKLSKVTTAIHYRDPFATVEEDGTIQVQQELLDRCEREGETIQTVRASILSYFMDTLVSHSAQKVYIVDLGRQLTDGVMSGLPDFFKPRIEWADRQGKIKELISETVSPIYDELEDPWEKKRKEAGIEGSHVEGHEHGLCILQEFLRTLAVSMKYDTEADVDIDLACEATRRIRKQIESPESLAILSRIEGILNCYWISEKIPTMVTTQPTPEDLLTDLLDDARIISLSKSRYLLGIPGKFRVAMVEMKRKMREILSDRRKRQYLAMASKIGNIATKRVNIELPEIEVDPSEKFSPPLISLHEDKPLCLRTLRELPKTMP